MDRCGDGNLVVEEDVCVDSGDDRSISSDDAEWEDLEYSNDWGRQVLIVFAVYWMDVVGRIHGYGDQDRLVAEGGRVFQIWNHEGDREHLAYSNDLQGQDIVLRAV
ncbi:hypothetical protein TTRE_0000363201 [Trichuris trichiura]|uniref:Uncharacterized protein n=1 Tax=Trichuris trichiura TaxID=36087 RepID=A0A077Z9K7_TRITR|nr:hypothetical protein TTRE_0000363201 [Trichuris trichiura]